MPSAYDEIAGMYDALWADWYLPAALPALEKLFFSQLFAGARVLDVCCGSGHVTKELVRRGYEVTGVDSSAALIAIAQKQMPGTDFRVQDVRDLQLLGGYEAVLSTFDSLNHILSAGELREVFAGVHRVLQTGGLFVFDMNLEQAYSADLRQWMVEVGDDSVGMMRGTYDFATQKAATELIWFVRNRHEQCWRQHRSVVEERCYPESEILLALDQVGFKTIEALSATEAGVTAELGFGRVFFSARA